MLFTTLSLLFSQKRTCPTTEKNPWQWPSHSNWFIGNGIRGKFEGGTLKIYSIPNIHNYEGVSGASDDWGNLLFLNNGRLVWDATGKETFNGLLEGNENKNITGSASQGCVAVRHPLDTLNYYVFTTDDALSNTYGLNYCVLDRKGNIKGGPIRLGGYRTTEGIAATRHANGVDIWVTVMGSGSTNLYTYLVTCNGVINKPVISAVGVAKIIDQERGGLAFSWDSKYFVQAHNDFYPNADKKVTVYKFDNRTGIISDPHHLGSTTTNEDVGYDVTFSPDNSKIYFSTPTAALGCYDISSWDTNTMKASFKIVANKGGAFGAIEIGADGNIYMGGVPRSILGKISGDLNDPSSLSLSSVSGAISNYGLPTMYLPPAEYPLTEEAGPFCTDDPAVDLNTHWVCTGIDAEDPVNIPDAYSGKGITDKGKGIFDPKTAGEGTHMIVFKRCSVSDTIYIVVKPCGCPDTTLKNMPPICADGKLNLNDYKVTTEEGTWSIENPPTGATATIDGTEFLGNNTVAGIYTVRFTLKKKNNGCPEYAERTIVVNPLPTIKITTDTIKCYGQTTKCIATGASVYNWSTGDTGSTVILKPLALTTYTITGSDKNGCKDTQTFTVPVPPPLELKTSFTNVSCLGTKGTASVSVTGGTGTYTYNWSNGETQSDIKNLSAGHYTVIVTDANQCKDSGRVDIGDPVYPKADFSFSAACIGVPIEFKDNSTVGAGNTITAYKWDFGESGSADNTSNQAIPPPRTYNNTGSFTITLVVITDGSCADTITKPLDIWPTPKVEFGSPKSGCKPVCVDFKDSSFVQNGKLVKWNWNFGDPASGNNNSDLKDPQHCYNIPGFYDVSLTVESDKGCKASLEKKKLIEVYDNPVAAFTPNTSEAEIFNAAISFFDKSSGNPVSWHWDFGVKTSDSDTSKLRNPSYTYADTGHYDVCLTVKNVIGCKDVVCHPIVIKPYWTFYIPNAFTPNDDGINDTFNGTGYNILEYQLWIFDRWGNMIYTTGKTPNPECSKAWDGKANNGSDIAQMDVYVWKVALTDIFNKPHTYVGTVSLVK